MIDDGPDRDPGVRYEACPCCGGDRGWEVWTGGYDPRNGEPHGYWAECTVCDENGGVWIPVEPIIMEDLECCPQ